MKMQLILFIVRMGISFAYKSPSVNTRDFLNRLIEAIPNELVYLIEKSITDYSFKETKRSDFL